jgi:hypothetical protein
MEYLEAWWTLIHGKNLKSKISCQTPFKGSKYIGRGPRVFAVVLDLSGLRLAWKFCQTIWDALCDRIYYVPRFS